MHEHNTQVTPQKCVNKSGIKCKNESFAILEEEFDRYNWFLQINESDHIVFKSPTSDYDYYEINVDKTKIDVIVPLKKTIYKYKTSFNSSLQACEYIEMHLDDFINS